MKHNIMDDVNLTNGIINIFIKQTELRIKGAELHHLYYIIIRIDVKPPSDQGSRSPRKGVHLVPLYPEMRQQYLSSNF